MSGRPVPFRVVADVGGEPVVEIDGVSIPGRIAGVSLAAARGEFPRLGVEVVGDPAEIVGEGIVVVEVRSEHGDDSPRDVAEWLRNIDPAILSNVALANLSLGDDTITSIMRTLIAWAEGVDPRTMPGHPGYVP